MKKKYIALLGSTGSIGLNTIDVIRYYQNYFKIKYISIHKSIQKLIEQIQEFRPKKAVITDLQSYNEFIVQYGKKYEECSIVYGYNELIELVLDDTIDIVINGLIGIHGLKASIEAIKKHKIVAIANKESIVVGGEIIKQQIIRSKGKIIPIDSEHSGLSILLESFKKHRIRKLFLTASGGAIYTKSLKEIETMDVEDILVHPNWKMGKKITVDSSTMMNKCLELIEAYYLFDYPVDQIEVIIHPKSYVHAIIQTYDFCYYSQMSFPDMRLPIQNSLTYPEIWENPFLSQKNNKLIHFPSLDFFSVDLKKYPLLKLGYEVLKKGDSYPIILNAVNDIAVEKYLKGKIPFLDIHKMIEKEIENHNPIKITSLDQILNLDMQKRQELK